MANYREARRDHIRGTLQRYRAQHQKEERDRLQRQDYHRQAESLERATRHGLQWTGPEVEVVLRPDLTTRDVASLLGRSFYAVRTVRSNARRDPRVLNLAGTRR